MGAWHFLVLSAGKPHAHKIPPFRGGGGGFWAFLREGGVECQFYFYGRGDLSEYLYLQIMNSDLCWVGTASGPFLENNSTPLKLGKKWVFAEIPKWV